MSYQLKFFKYLSDDPMDGFRTNPILEPLELSNAIVPVPRFIVGPDPGSLPFERS